MIGADRNVVGKAMLCIYEVMPDEVNTTGQCATLFSVYTLPRFRGHGYMERLLRFLLEKAKELGVKEALACAEIKAIPLHKRDRIQIKRTGNIYKAVIFKMTVYCFLRCMDNM